MKRTLLSIIGRKLLIHLHRIATTTLKKHNSKLTIRGYAEHEYESKTEYTYRLEVTIHPTATHDFRYVTTLVAVSNSELIINISGYGHRILDITNKKSIDTITQFVRETCETAVK